MKFKVGDKVILRSLQEYKGEVIHIDIDGPWPIQVNWINMNNIEFTTNDSIGTHFKEIELIHDKKEMRSIILNKLGI